MAGSRKIGVVILRGLGVWCFSWLNGDRVPSLMGSQWISNNLVEVL